ncbi:hypothetical protein [Gracilibacillus saliphilus]|uniref:hypothetical protein n=1 Tax=Gracilibacillus saliphilus TaxID=543890 RepID=UPI0013D823BC|nr:hypothetical protein [Gracilibacillus saliphilus]
MTQERLRILKYIYDLASANDDIQYSVDESELNTTQFDLKYLHNKGFVVRSGDGWMITAEGIDVVENGRVF